MGKETEQYKHQTNKQIYISKKKYERHIRVKGAVKKENEEPEGLRRKREKESEGLRRKREREREQERKEERKEKETQGNKREKMSLTTTDIFDISVQLCARVSMVLNKLIS